MDVYTLRSTTDRAKGILGTEMTMRRDEKDAPPNPSLLCHFQTETRFILPPRRPAPSNCVVSDRNTRKYVLPFVNSSFLFLFCMVYWCDYSGEPSVVRVVVRSCVPPLQKRLDDLHQSQVQAYREAATEAIQSWAMSAPLEPMEEHDTEEAFVDRCVSALVKGKRGANASSSSSPSPPLPNWKLDDIEALAGDEIRKRARAVYEKYHPTEEIGDADMAGDAEADVEGGEDVHTGDEDDDEHEEGEADEEDSRDEEGELDEQGGAAGAASSATTDDAKQNPNARTTSRNKRKGGTNASAKTTPVKKKPSNSRSYRGNRSQANRGGRRGGRGGGNNARSNN
jgi:hypothetical protein